MKNKIFTIIFIFIFVFIVNFIAYEIYFPKNFPEKNIISIEKEANILNNLKTSSASLLWQKNPEKIISKWIFIKENIILTVAHWVDTKEDNYKIFFDKNNFFSNAKLIFKDEKKDIAFLKTNTNFKNFKKIIFWNVSENDYIFYYKWDDFERVKISKIENEKIFIKNIFEKWDSWTIFYNNKKEIVWILSQYDLKEKFWIINILDEKSFYKNL